MKAWVTRSEWNCILSYKYIDKEVEVVPCKSPHLKGLYRLVNEQVLFHKNELIF